MLAMDVIVLGGRNQRKQCVVVAIIKQEVLGMDFWEFVIFYFQVYVIFQASVYHVDS